MRPLQQTNRSRLRTCQAPTMAVKSLLRVGRASWKRLRTLLVKGMCWSSLSMAASTTVELACFSVQTLSVQANSTSAVYATTKSTMSKSWIRKRTIDSTDTRSLTWNVFAAKQPNRSPIRAHNASKTFLCTIAPFARSTMINVRQREFSTAKSVASVVLVAAKKPSTVITVIAVWAYTWKITISAWTSASIKIVWSA